MQNEQTTREIFLPGVNLMSFAMAPQINLKKQIIDSVEI